VTDRSTEEQEDQEGFDLLDDYLRRLHAGQQPDRDGLAQAHPKLAPALNCLDLLEGIASSLSHQASPSAGAEGPGAGETAAWSSPALQMPSGFGAYELLEEIGRGGMGVVYKARQKELDRVVALKMILASHLASPEHVRRFRAEAKAAAQLQHDHIVRIHDVGEVHGQHYFSMEYVKGRSLAERIASGPMELEAAVRLLCQVARAVGHSHQQGIVHRDLKPKNILLDAEGRPYVADFGLAKVLRSPSDMTATHAFLGTASYMAPEQAAGRSAEASPASDVYSLGAILYELLTGRPPFREESFLDTLMQVLSREPTLPRQLNRHVPRALELICLKCLAKPPQDRYASADALADDLERFLKGEALVARPPNPAQRLWNWARREPALASRLGVLGIFFLVEMIINALTPVAEGIHATMLLMLAVWAATAVAFQQLLKIPRWSFPGRFMWGMLDSALLFAVLLVADGVASPLVVAYPLLIVGSGLWFRLRFVWFMTGLSLLSYGAHVVHFYSYRKDHDLETFDPSWHRHLIFAVALIALGGIVAYLVHRVRTLSSYCGQKPETLGSGQ
jgi:tRNA A-37 threonylcarbamoyl transferase component Bud32